MADPFRRFHSEEPGERGPEDRPMEDPLTMAYMGFLTEWEGMIEDPGLQDWEEVYESGKESLKGVRYGKGDIARFSKDIRKYEGEEGFTYTAGIFLSAMINSVEGDVSIEMGTEKEVWCLGYGLSGKKLFIKGNAGNYLGHRMRSGEIRVEGKKGKYVGDLISGYIYLNGRVVNGDITFGR